MTTIKKYMHKGYYYINTLKSSELDFVYYISAGFITFAGFPIIKCANV